MRAMTLTQHGTNNDVLEYGEMPDPTPRDGEVLVALQAAALNRLDLFVRNGIPGITLSFPHVPGADGTGRVEALGPGVEGLAVGQEVVLQPGLSCARCDYCRAGEQSLCVRFRILGEHVSGTFAEKIVVPARNVYPAPPNLSPAERAAFPLAGLTAWRMLVTRANLRPGETVLIHGIGSGVAVFALQIARLIGARVIATSGEDSKLEKAHALGADATLNYRHADVGKEVRRMTGKRGVDVVVDSVGEATWGSSIEAAAKGGRIVTCGATTGPHPKEDIRIIFWKQLSIFGSTMGTDREFAALLGVVGEGKLKPVVDRVYSLAEAKEAYDRMGRIGQFGKLVLTIA